MRILLTNDDGIRAPGIIALHDALAGRHSEHPLPLGDELVTIAPYTVQSATSHGVTFHTPLMVRSETITPSMKGVSVDARPADCVKLAVANLWPERFGENADGQASRPDLVISGMNAGANVGINVIYSGTVAAALEAAFLGIPAIAVSLHLGRGEPDFARASSHARHAIDSIVASGLLTKHACVSVNIPITEIGMPIERTSGYSIRVCPMNTHGLNDKYERRIAPGGEVYYWAAGHGLDFKSTDAESDVHALFDRCITVTPLRYDLTKKSMVQKWRSALGSE